MGLCNRTTREGVWEIGLRSEPNYKVIALAGNPNVGKSTVFNSLTGLNQHTGNWPGKTVIQAQGNYQHQDRNFILVDTPGTYSLMANSAEEEVARDFICFGHPNAVIIVVDATCIERNLNLVLQTLEFTEHVVVCVNLLDEARRKKIQVNLPELSQRLGVPVVGTTARSGKGLKALMDAVYMLSFKNNTAAPLKIEYDKPIEQAVDIVEASIKGLIGNQINSRWVALKLLDGDKNLLAALQKYQGYDLMGNETVVKKLAEAKNILTMANIDCNLFRDKVVSRLVCMAEDIFRAVVTVKNKTYNRSDRKIDEILTSRIFGIPIMILLLSTVFWLTISGANVPSQMLATFLFWIEDRLTDFFTWAGTPAWVQGVLVLGIYRTLAWVVSVMLPPMAIFFPLFTLLEDLGYLPRVAFNLDSCFKKACAHGKQALTMCMGFGCNAAGIIGCRIIDSPRERLIATITNNFVPCNGRFPTLIAIITMFFAGSLVEPLRSLISTLILTAVIILGVVMTLFISKLLSQTILKGLPSSFVLELPPYRKPQIARVIIRSILDRTIFVLGRAVAVAAPAGLIIWLLANTQLGDTSILSYCAVFLDPLAKLIGLDGYILLAFILGFPANEIVFPIIIMSYMATGNLLELDGLAQLRQLLLAHGWTWLTAVCVMLFSLMHWPCGTTCWTIKQETQSWKWTLTSFLIPSLCGFSICFIVANIVRLLGLV